MKPDSNATMLADQVRAANNIANALVKIRNCYDVGHVTYHLLRSISAEAQVDTLYVRSTYPAEWIGVYLLNNFIDIDPIVQHGRNCVLPFDWSQVALDFGATELMKTATTFGLGSYGYTIPIADKVGRKALISFNSHKSQSLEAWRNTVFKAKSDWLDLAYVLHGRAIFEICGTQDPVPRLSPRELETLYWTAQGKDYRDIAGILEISDYTIRTYTRSVRHKLNCSTLAQAVAKAVNMRLITL